MFGVGDCEYESDMLTSLSVSGYKSLQNSDAKFTPFTVIIGRNNVGKSNLFDILRLLSHWAQMPVAAAFRPERHRGDPIESFHSEADPSLKIACGFDLTGVPHPSHEGTTLKYPTLDYECDLVFQRGVFALRSESLKGRTSRKPRNLITPDVDRERISINRDTALSGKTRIFPLPAVRSVLTIIDDAELYPHIVALARELSAWRFFHFEPEILREPSPTMDILELESSGRGLSGFYDTLSNLDPERFAATERALRRGIPDAQGIRLLQTGDRRRLLAVVRDDGREFSARVLSDGTLRFLALLALAYAPRPPGLVCFEEPENGVHPARLPFVVDTLRGLSERGREGGPRSQVLVNSHSPYLVDLLRPSEMIRTSQEEGRTFFTRVEEDLFGRPELKEMLEKGEQTLGEIWSRGDLRDA